MSDDPKWKGHTDLLNKLKRPPPTTAEHNAHPRGRFTPAIDSSNLFFVRTSPRMAGFFHFETNTAAKILCTVSRDEAINLAAWIEVLTEGSAEIAQLVKEIKKQ